MSESGNEEAAQLQRELAACARGEADALQRLYAALSAQLFGVLVRILRRRDLAEEALQDTFLSVWRKASDYDATRGAASTWIFVIARHRALDILRRERREVPLAPDVLTDICDRLPDPDAAAGGWNPVGSRRLRACLERLSAEQRRSILLAYFFGLTREEIAARLESPLGTVKSWVRRGLAGLKRCLEAVT
ncbi:MAG: sigma-70 family RNA polymerase sigma factor [Gammaproteobacteria bacterium]